MAYKVYDSFAAVPLDDPPDWEGDDSTPVTRRPPEGRALFAVGAQRTTRSIVVPYFALRPGATGPAVYALKRAHARFRDHGRLALLMSVPLKQRSTWGSFFTTEFKVTQRRLGVAVTGWYDTATHHALAPYYDSLALSLLNAIPTTDPRVSKVLGWTSALYNRRYAVQYSQYRPSQLGAPATITRADCSGSIAAAMDWADVLPQVDWRWSNTDTQILQGRAVASLGAAEPGDVVFYGYGSDPNHEALYLGDGRVWSFGSYPVKILPVDYDRSERGGRIAIRRFVS